MLQVKGTASGGKVLGNAMPSVCTRVQNGPYRARAVRAAGGEIREVVGARIVQGFAGQ